MSNALLARSKGKFAVIDVDGIGTELYCTAPALALDGATTCFVVCPGTRLALRVNFL